MNYYREKLVNVILYWVLLTIPIVYFAVTFFYQYTLSTLLTPYMQVDPVTISIFLGAFLSLSKPIGGLVFGAAFWNISRSVKYDRKIRAYMIISGWGIFLIFAANQAGTQIVSPYPPFGLVTVTVLNLAAYLMLVGIYNSAILVSANNNLRQNIRKYAVRSKLLDLIGRAEMEREIQKTVTDIIRSQDSLGTDRENEFELDETELKRYMDIVIREVKMKETDGSKLVLISLAWLGIRKYICNNCSFAHLRHNDNSNTMKQTRTHFIRTCLGKLII